MRTNLVRMLAVVSAAFILGGLATADDKDKVMSIEDIMKKHAGNKSIFKALATQIKEGKWDDAKENAKTVKKMGESLGKNEAPKGEAASWKKLSEKYKENTLSVFKGIEKKDAKLAGEGLAKIGKSCMECHKVHKP